MEITTDRLPWAQAVRQRVRAAGRFPRSEVSVTTELQERETGSRCVRQVTQCPAAARTRRLWNWEAAAAAAAGKKAKSGTLD